MKGQAAAEQMLTFATLMLVLAPVAYMLFSFSSDSSASSSTKMFFWISGYLSSEINSACSEDANYSRTLFIVFPDPISNVSLSFSSDELVLSESVLGLESAVKLDCRPSVDSESGQDKITFGKSFLLRVLKNSSGVYVGGAK